MPLKEEFESQGQRLFRWRSYLPLLFLPILLPLSREAPSGLGPGWLALCVGVSCLGFLVRGLAIGSAAPDTSGRNTVVQKAGALNTTGLYSVVRHPLYLGNFLLTLGIALYTGSPARVALYVLAFALYYERIMFAEEEFLRRQFAEVFTAWAQATPAFLPRPRGWRAPSLPFSWRVVLVREYRSAFAALCMFVLLEAAQTWAATGSAGLGLGWSLALGLGVGLFGLMRWIIKSKNKGRLAAWLHVDGR